jgi:hypothetical protein
MSGELGPIDIQCDAPPYPVVRACERLGLRTPQDVRWSRVNRFALLGGQLTCSCDQPLPPLESYTFTFVTGKQATYYLAQCPHCNAIFWDNP